MAMAHAMNKLAAPHTLYVRKSNIIPVLHIERDNPNTVKIKMIVLMLPSKGIRVIIEINANA